MSRMVLFFLIIVFSLISCASREEENIEIDPFIYTRGKLEKGETLAKSLIDLGVENSTVYQMVNQLDTIYDLRRSQPADSFVVKYDTLNVIHELRYMPNNIHTYRVIKDSLANFFVQVDTLRTTIFHKVVSGTIETSLWQAVLDAEASPALAVLFTQIFQWDIDFFIDPQKGDKFKMIFEQYLDENQRLIRTGNILAAQYSTIGYDKIAYLYTDAKGYAKYYDESGKSFQKAFLKSPLNYKRITSYFGRRTHPITKKVSHHNGVDYAAAYGTPVEATADGTVIYASWHPNHTGNTVKIRHANGYVTLYGHLSKYGKYKIGDRVKQHDIVGYVGSTGRSTGPHLHYTIYHHGNPINPLKLQNVSGPPVPQNEMDLFKETVDTMKGVFDSDQDSIAVESEHS